MDKEVLLGLVNVMNRIIDLVERAEGENCISPASTVIPINIKASEPEDDGVYHRAGFTSSDVARLAITKALEVAPSLEHIARFISFSGTRWETNRRTGLPPTAKYVAKRLSAVRTGQCGSLPKDVSVRIISVCKSISNGASVQFAANR